MPYLPVALRPSFLHEVIARIGDVGRAEDGGPERRRRNPSPAFADIQLVFKPAVPGFADGLNRKTLKVEGLLGLHHPV
jgi:hypothetical protein